MAAWDIATRRHSRETGQANQRVLVPVGRYLVSAEASRPILLISFPHLPLSGRRLYTHTVCQLSFRFFHRPLLNHQSIGVVDRLPLSAEH